MKASHNMTIRLNNWLILNQPVVVEYLDKKDKLYETLRRVVRRYGVYNKAYDTIAYRIESLKIPDEFAGYVTPEDKLILAIFGRYP